MMKRLLLAFLKLALVMAVGVNAQLNKKVMVGYQGWFQASEGAWRHWSTDGQAPSPGHLAFDLFPELSEYETLYDAGAGLVMPSGANAQLYSCSDAATVATHFRWMQEYNIDGAFLQRFLSETRIPEMLRFRNLVLNHTRAAAAKHNRTFAVMWDLSGTPPEHSLQWLEEDFAVLSSMGVFESPQYQRHDDGRLLLVVWGLGFSDRKGDLATELALIQFLHGKGFAVMGGVPFWWRSGTHDSRAGWSSVYAALDLISPWSVGRWSSVAEFDVLFRQVVDGDFSATASSKQGYAPVVWPGFSWSNLKNDSSIFNAIPRNCGRFMQHSAELYAKRKPLFLYIAMFDEVNEGTAIFKAATSSASTPANARFLDLSADACGPMESDAYLKQAGGFHTLF